MDAVSISESISGRRARLRLTLALLAGALLTLSGCASTGGEGTPKGSRDVITSEQLAEIPSVTALQAINRLKSNWLRTRGPDSFRGAFPLAVIVDGVRQEGLFVLDSYRCGAIEEIRLVRRSRAIMLYGDYASGGAIVVTTLK